MLARSDIAAAPFRAVEIPVLLTFLATPVSSRHSFSKCWMALGASSTGTDTDTYTVLKTVSVTVCPPVDNQPEQSRSSKIDCAPSR